MSERRWVVAIDGPAASGKSTTARLAAERLGFLYLDTGAMYRAVAWKALEQGVSPDDVEALGRLAESMRLEIHAGGPVDRVVVDGRDVTDAIREPRVSRVVSRVARVSPVRRAMVERQRGFAAHGSVVAEGRDIGTVVFPDAEVKIYLVASLGERARRRREELHERGVEQGRDELEQEIRARDELDSNRNDSPLRRAEGAFLLDTTGRSIAEQVDEVVRVVREKISANPS